MCFILKQAMVGLLDDLKLGISLKFSVEHHFCFKDWTQASVFYQHLYLLSSPSYQGV